MPNPLIIHQAGHRGNYPAYGAMLLVCVALIGLAAACRNWRTPAGSAGVAQYMLVETLRVGDEAAGDTVLFGNVIDITVDAKGRLYVLDQLWPCICVFSSTGELADVIGREGAGPGEFNFATGVTIGPGDSVYVFDRGLNRLTAFTPVNYDYAYSIPLRAIDVDVLVPTEMLGATPRGLLVKYVMFFTSTIEKEGFESVRLLDWQGKVAAGSVAQQPRGQSLPFETERSVIDYALPFGRRPFFAADYGGTLYHGWNETIRIETATWDAEEQHVIESSHDPVPITEAERDSILARSSENWRDRIREAMPNTKSAYNALLPDDDGRLWLQLSSLEGASETTWVIVDAESGAAIGQTTLPHAVELYAVRRGKAVGTVQHEPHDAPLVIVWDVET